MQQPTLCRLRRRRGPASAQQKKEARLHSSTFVAVSDLSYVASQRCRLRPDLAASPISRTRETAAVFSMWTTREKYVWRMVNPKLNSGMKKKRRQQRDAAHRRRSTAPSRSFITSSECARGTMKVLVKTLKESTYTIEMEPSATVLQCKQQLEPLVSDDTRSTHHGMWQQRRLRLRAARGCERRGRHAAPRALPPRSLSLLLGHPTRVSHRLQTAATRHCTSSSSPAACSQTQ